MNIISFAIKALKQLLNVSKLLKFETHTDNSLAIVLYIYIFKGFLSTMRN